MNRNPVPWRNSFPRFPVIVNSRTFEDLWDHFFDDFNSASEATEGLLGSNQVVPYDVRNVIENNKIIGTEIIYTLAGFSQNEVNVEIDDVANTITIKADKADQAIPNDAAKYEYIRRGIARRSIQVSYRINGIDKEKITASFKDGLLSVYLPLEGEKENKPKIRKINLLNG